jgi:radical SAM superfamily enzyme YgiQ (UPF0313 family)
VGITAGNLDSMLNKLTAQKKNRGPRISTRRAARHGCAPTAPPSCTRTGARQALPGVPIVLGGIEASLRRIAHYDYWSDSGAALDPARRQGDLLIFGMGERPVWEVARRLAKGEPDHQLRDMRGTAHVLRKGEWEAPEEPLREATQDALLPSYERSPPPTRASTPSREMSRAFQYETNPGNGRPLVQPHGDEAVYFNPPAFAARHRGDGRDGRALRPALRARRRTGRTSSPSPPTRR